MKYKAVVCVGLLGLLGCSAFDPYSMFRLLLQRFPGQNFDEQLKYGSLFREINKNRKITTLSKNNKLISYLVTWNLDCTYVVNVDIKTRIIESTHIYNDTAACRTSGH